MTRSPRFSRTLSTHELARFLAYLAATGNFALACVHLGRAKSGLYKRRARDPFFAAECEAALADFRIAPSPSRKRTARDGFASIHPRTPLKSTWNTLALSTHAGRPQIRRAVSGSLTSAGRQAFLKTLAATANIRFSAQSVGVAPSSIYRRRRHDPHFARAMEEAIDTALAALEMRVIEASGVFDDEEDYSPSHPGERQGVGAEAHSLSGGQASTASGARTIDTLTAGEALQFLELHRRRRK